MFSEDKKENSIAEVNMSFVLDKAGYDSPWQYALTTVSGRRYFFTGAVRTSRDHVMLKVDSRWMAQFQASDLKNYIIPDSERGVEIRIDQIAELFDTPFGS